jgi:hypothetical protein
VFLGLIAALILFIVALSFIAPWDVGDEGWVPWAVVAIGIASLAYIALIRRRPIPTTSLEALARVYRAWFFIGVGVASAAALGGSLAYSWAVASGSISSAWPSVSWGCG